MKVCGVRKHLVSVKYKASKFWSVKATFKVDRVEFTAELNWLGLLISPVPVNYVRLVDCDSVWVSRYKERKLYFPLKSPTKEVWDEVSKLCGEEVNCYFWKDLVKQLYRKVTIEEAKDFLKRFENYFVVVSSRELFLLLDELRYEEFKLQSGERVYKLQPAKEETKKQSLPKLVTIAVPV